MTVAFVAVGPKAGSATADLPVAYPSGIQAGDLLVLLRACWLSGMQLATPAGWTSRADGAGGTNTTTDAHNSRINIATKIADGTETGTLATISDGGTVSGQIGMIAVYRNATGAWDIAGVGASTAGDGSHGTSRGTGTSGTLALQPDDLILAGIATDTDAVLSATGALITFSGTTPNAATLRTNGANGTDAGLDGNVDLADRFVASGTTTVGGAFAWTTSVSQCGPVGFVRLREVAAAGTAYTAEPVDTAGGSDTAATIQDSTRTTADTAAATDTASITSAATRTVSDTAGATDAASAAATADRAFVDTAGGSDLAEVVLGRSASAEDAAGASDAAAVTRESARQADDVAAGTDQTITVVTVDRPVADAADATDAVTITRTVTRAAADTAGGIDAALVEYTGEGAASVDDLADAYDATTVTTTRTRAAADTADAADAAATATDRQRSGADTAGAVDAVVIARGVVADVADTAGATDGATTELAQAATVEDTATASDTATAVISQRRDVTITALYVDARRVTIDQQPREVDIIVTPRTVTIEGPPMNLNRLGVEYLPLVISSTPPVTSGWELSVVGIPDTGYYPGEAATWVDKNSRPVSGWRWLIAGDQATDPGGAPFVLPPGNYDVIVRAIDDPEHIYRRLARAICVR